MNHAGVIVCSFVEKQMTTHLLASRNRRNSRQPNFLQKAKNSPIITRIPGLVCTPLKLRCTSYYCHFFKDNCFLVLHVCRYTSSRFDNSSKKKKTVHAKSCILTFLVYSGLQKSRGFKNSYTRTKHSSCSFSAISLIYKHASSFLFLWSVLISFKTGKSLHLSNAAAIYSVIVAATHAIYFHYNNNLEHTTVI